MKFRIGIVLLLGFLYLGSFFVPVNVNIAVLFAIVTFLALVIAAFTTFFQGIFTWRKTSRFWFVPFLLTLLFIFSTGEAGRLKGYLNDEEFESHLVVYNQLVADVRSGSVPATPEPKPTDMARLHLPSIPTYLVASMPVRVDVAREGDKVLVVVVLVSNRLAHTGYLYRNYAEGDKSVPDSMRLTKGIREVPVKGDWYAFSD